MTDTDKEKAAFIRAMSDIYSQAILALQPDGEFVYDRTRQLFNVWLAAKRDAIPAQPDLSLLQRYYIGDVSHALPLRNGAYVLFNDVETMLNRMSGGAAVTDEAKDVARDLAKRLRIKSGMIAMGERIAWGSDSALMDEAANFIDAAIEAHTRGKT